MRLFAAGSAGLTALRAAFARGATGSAGFAFGGGGRHGTHTTRGENAHQGDFGDKLFHFQSSFVSFFDARRFNKEPVERDKKTKIRKFGVAAAGQLRPRFQPCEMGAPQRRRKRCNSPRKSWNRNQKPMPRFAPTPFAAGTVLRPSRGCPHSERLRGNSSGRDKRTAARAGRTSARFHSSRRRALQGAKRSRTAQKAPQECIAWP